MAHLGFEAGFLTWINDLSSVVFMANIGINESVLQDPGFEIRVLVGLCFAVFFFVSIPQQCKISFGEWSLQLTI